MNPIDGMLDEIVRLYAVQAVTMYFRLQPVVLGTATALFALQFAWDLGRWALSSEPNVFGKALHKLTLFLILFGLVRFSFLWLPAIPAGFAALGERLTGIGLSPSAVFAQGLNLAFSFFASWDRALATILPTPSAFLRVGSMLVILIAFTWVALQLARTLIEISLALGSLVIFLATSAHSATFGLFEGYLRYFLELSVRLYMLYIIVHVGQHFGRAWDEAIGQTSLIDSDLRLHFVLLAATVLFALLAWKVPNEIAARIAGGFSLAGLNPMGRDR